MDVTPALIEERRRLGIDTYDEVWDGEYRVNPYPFTEHQRVVEELIEHLRPVLRRAGRGRLRLGLNVIEAAEGWHNFRCPDLVFVSAAREHVVGREGIRVEGPDAVFEIRSPGDDTYKKLPFYARLGVCEVIVIHRDTKQPEVFRLRGDPPALEYVQVAPDTDGWVGSQTMDVAFRWVDGVTPVVDLRDEREQRDITRI